MAASPSDTKDAIVLRILILCAEHDMTIHELALKSEMSPASLYSILNKKSKNPRVLSVHKLCMGLGISLGEFFDCDLFNNLEQEVR